MSVKAMSAAFETGDQLHLAAVDRLILLRLGDWADDYGYCFPGLGDLVAKVGVDERTIRRHLATLEDAELVVRCHMGGGRNRSTLYRMLPNVLPDAENAPGKIRYLERYHLKGDILSGFLGGTKGAARRKKGTDDADKRGHSSVPRSVIIHNYPSDDLALKPPREPGESRAAYARRLADA